MTEEQTVKLYSAAFFAWREENGQPTIHIKPGIVIAFALPIAGRPLVSARGTGSS